MFLQNLVVLPRGIKRVPPILLAPPARLTLRFHSAQTITSSRSTQPMNDTLCAYRPVAFYSLVPISTERVKELRDTIDTKLKSLGVWGRIYLAPSSGIGGINCQISVPSHLLQAVKQFFSNLGEFGPIEFTEGLQDTDKPSFPSLSVTIKENLVATKARLKTEDLQDQCVHLSPAAWHKELTEKGQNVFLLDMRNHYEYDLGHFNHAIKMDVDTFRDGMQVLDKLVENLPKNEDIYMYCTGGIRCAIAGPYLQKQKGFNHVKMAALQLMVTTSVNNSRPKLYPFSEERISPLTVGEEKG
ncbi:hypothetical protein EC973_003675 [Apophysomyces ossiformis]|uniref:Rhodanese domain-containing protein n=1 Tax=Apophysomyces ossiformis TaxID=679940 RepID=A0A8H7ELX5_9FUNG|nr:hypothetical protein EC973_003675 [Apophysomyces ossiformis]